MLRYRTNTEIYADRPYGIPPDDNDIRRSVRAHICPDEIRVIEDFYHWILVMPDPYDRECYSARTCEYLTECLHSDDPDCRLCNTDIYCEVRQALHRIIRSATGDQVNMEHSFDAHATPSSDGQPILTTTSIIENNKYYIIMEKHIHIDIHDNQNVFTGDGITIYQTPSAPQTILPPPHTIEDILPHTQCIPQPSSINPQPSLAIPRPNDYVSIIEWLQCEKNSGRDHLKNAKNNRSELCRQLSKTFGWPVDPCSFNRAWNRK